MRLPRHYYPMTIGHHCLPFEPCKTWSSSQPYGIPTSVCEYLPVARGTVWWIRFTSNTRASVKHVNYGQRPTVSWLFVGKERFTTHKMYHTSKKNKISINRATHCLSTGKGPIFSWAISDSNVSTVTVSWAEKEPVSYNFWTRNDLHVSHI